MMQAKQSIRIQPKHRSYKVFRPNRVELNHRKKKETSPLCQIQAIKEIIHQSFITYTYIAKKICDLRKI